MLYFPRHRLRPHLTPDQHAYFHVVSRVVDRRYIFGDSQKAKFLEYMRRYELFCKVQVLGYCLMDDHFHIIVDVPGRPAERPSQEALLHHVKETLGQTIHDQYQDRIDFWSQQLLIGEQRELPEGRGDGLESPLDAIIPQMSDLAAYAHAQLEKVSRDIWRRMYDVSQFIFSLKQQFSHWYNKQSNRVGTLWEERFRATLIQPGAAVAEVVAYVDLNPVRAGLVGDAKDYPWSQIGAAVGGDARARHAIMLLSEKPGWLERGEVNSAVSSHLSGVLPVSRMEMPLLLMCLLLERRGGQRGRGPDDLDPQGYLLPNPNPASVSYVTGPLRSFVRGGAIGDSAYLEDLFKANRDQFGPKRRSAARGISFELPDQEQKEGEELVVPPHKNTLRIPGIKALRSFRKKRNNRDAS